MGFGNGHDNGANVSRQMNAKHKSKPAKTVFSGDMAIHVWAQRTQAWGRNAKASCYFDGDTLYSYGSHYVAACFATGRKGQLVVLFNNQRYGVTTNSQVWTAMHAVKESTPKFTVRNPAAKTDSEHIANLQDKLNSYNKHKEAANNTRRRPDSRLSSLRHMDSLVSDMREYRDTFLKASQFKIPAKNGPLDNLERSCDFSKHVSNFKEAQSLWTRRIGHNRGYGRNRKASIVQLRNHLANMLRSYAKARRSAIDSVVLPKLDIPRTIQLYRWYRKAAKRSGQPATYWPNSGFFYFATRVEKDAIKKIDDRNGWPLEVISSALLWIESAPEGVYGNMLKYSLDSLEKIPDYCADNALPVPAEYAKTLAETRAAFEICKAAKAKKEREKLEGDKEKIEAWRKGVANVRPSHEWPTLLRVNPSSGVVETSRGAAFPIDDARKAWPVIKACYDSARAWKRNGATIPMGHFQVDAIKTDGTIIAGCHTLQRGEVESFAKVLGLA